MGYFRHETIVVSSYDRGAVLAAHTVAKAAFGVCGMEGLVGEVVPHAVNGGASFFIAPDGSKEGWTPSDDAAEARKEFINWLDESVMGHVYDWALVVIGGDDDEYKVVDHAGKVDKTNV